MNPALATANRVALYGYALHLTHDPARADDLVQDTLLRALRYSHSFKPEANVDTWLRTILRNVFVDSWHRDRRATSLRDQANPATSLPLDVDSDLVAAAIAQLPDEQRVAILLREIDGYSYAEIAAQTDTPIGTVMSRLRRGRTRLHALLRDHAIELGLTEPGTADRPRTRAWRACPSPTAHAAPTHS